MGNPQDGVKILALVHARIVYLVKKPKIREMRAKFTKQNLLAFCCCAAPEIFKWLYLGNYMFVLANFFREVR